MRYVPTFSVWHKLLSLVTLLSFSFAIMPIAEATTYFYAGTDDRWERPTNWATAPKVATGSTAPGAGDTAVFVASGAVIGNGFTIRIRSAINIAGLVLMPTFSGILRQGTGTIRVGTAGIRIGSGRFIGGNAFVNSSGSYTQTGGIVTGLQNTFALSGSLTIKNNKTQFTSTGTIVMDGSGTQTMTLGTTATLISLKHLIVANMGQTSNLVTVASGALNLSGALTINKGKLDLTTNSRAMTVRQSINVAALAAAVLQTNSNVTLSGALSVLTPGSMNITGGTWTLNNPAASQIFNTGGSKLFGLTLANTGHTGFNSIIASGSAINLSGALTITTGKLDMTTQSKALVVRNGITVAQNLSGSLVSNSNITASGHVNVYSSGTLTITGGNFTLNGKGNQIFNLSGKKLNNLVVSNLGNTGANSVIASGGIISVSGALTINTGKLDMSTNSKVLVVRNGITVAASASGILASNSNIFSSGSITVNSPGSFSITAGTWTLNGGPQTLRLGGSHFSALTVNNPSNTVMVVGNPLLASGALILTAGTLNMNGSGSVVAGAATLNGGTFTAGTGSQVFEGALTLNGSTFTGGAGNVTVGGATALTTGTFTAPSGTLNLAGNFTHSPAVTYSNNSGLTNLNGTSQILSGATTFYKLTKSITAADTLTFLAGTTQTVANALTLNGTSSAKLSLASTTGGTPFLLASLGARSVQFVNVGDSQAVGVGITCVDCTNGGNTTNWSFVDTPASTTTSDSGGSSGGGGGGGGGGRSTTNLTTPIGTLNTTTRENNYVPAPHMTLKQRVAQRGLDRLDKMIKAARSPAMRKWLQGVRARILKRLNMK